MEEVEEGLLPGLVSVQHGLKEFLVPLSQPDGKDVLAGMSLGVVGAVAE